MLEYFFDSVDDMVFEKNEEDDFDNFDIDFDADEEPTD
jgi:hypothetical protein